MWFALALAAGPWEETAREHGCIFYKGPAEGSVLPIRAECDWPVAPEELEALLGDNAGHADIFSSIATSRVLSRTPQGEVVHQVHQASGISDREITLLMTATPIDGGTRFGWTKHDDQSSNGGDKVEIARNTGSWEVTRGPQGTHVVYELRYEAGGSVPSFLVRWFQGAGVRQVVGELKAAALR